MTTSSTDSFAGSSGFDGAAASDSAGATANLPLMAGRRTLIIGLGSTGTKISNQIMERVTGLYRTMDAVPWVRFLCLETAPVSEDKPIRANNRLFHLKVDSQNYRQLIETPAMYDNIMDFSKWNIPSVTREMGVDGITHGANNLRTLGRLALLFPENFLKVQNAIQDNVAFLQSLTDRDAEEKFNQLSGIGFKHRVRLNATADPTQVGAGVAAEVSVYVVGTLCGGTASGMAVDIGYLLKPGPMNGLRVTSTGIFLLPPTAYRDKLQLGNTVGALCELNHFSSEGSRHTVRFPHQPTVLRESGLGDSPFNHLYLMQTRTETREELARVMTSAADYLYTDIIGGASGERDGARTNIAMYLNQRDRFEASQKFFTTGVSVIEFPVAKVMRACLLRFGYKSFDRYREGGDLVDTRYRTLLDTVPLATRGALVKRLLSPRPGDPLPTGLAERLTEAIQNSARQARKDNAPLILTGAQLDSAVSDSRVAGVASLPGAAAYSAPVVDSLPGLGPRSAVETVEENMTAAQKELIDSISVAVRRFLLPEESDGLNFGLPLLEQFLVRLKQEMENARAAADGDAQGAMAAQNKALNRLRVCRRDPFVAVMGARVPAIDYALGRWRIATQELYQTRLLQICQPRLKSIYDEAIRYVERYLTRLNDGVVGLRRKTDDITSGMDSLYKRTNVAAAAASADGWSRYINGEELFYDDTVDKEYTNSINLAPDIQTGDFPQRERILGERIFSAWWKGALEALLLPPTRTGGLDTTPGAEASVYGEGRLLEIAEPARPLFSPVLARSVLDRLADLDTQADTVVRDAVQKCGIFLDWNPGNRYVPAMQKQYGYVFFDDRDPRAGAFRQMLGRTGALNAGMSGISLKESGWRDRYQVLFLRERGAFSIGTITPLDDADGGASSWWQNYKHPDISGGDGLRDLSSASGGSLDSAILHSRGDISEWTTWSRQQNADTAQLRQLFLIGVALGKVAFHGANDYNFEYTGRGVTGSRVLHLSRDLYENVRTMRREKQIAASDSKGLWDAIGSLRDAINDERRMLGDPTFVSRVQDFIAASGNRFTEQTRALTQDEVQGICLDYLFNDTLLLETYNALIPDNRVVRLLADVPDETGRRPYVCPNCLQKLGYVQKDLYVTQNINGQMRREFKCQYCNTPF